MTFPLVPLPTAITTRGGAPVALAATTPILAEPALAAVAAAMLGLSAAEHPGSTVTGQSHPGSAVVLEERAENDGETYLLRAGEGRVELTGSRLGLLRGLATLAQLRDLDLPGAPPGQVPAVQIEDDARLAHRGLMVDISRHFFGIGTLTKVVDLMARYKLNVLHLHLSDDQGWRIEIPGRPELTEVSGATQVGDGPGGYLSAEEFRELVAYAGDRGIQVVPEIDMPGHVNAAQHAIGALTETGAPTEAYRGTDVGFSKLSLDNPATAPFIDDALAALAAMGGGPYLHVGGDEVHTMPREEYVAFIEHLGEAVTRVGKLPMFWGEAAVAPLPAGAVVQLWDSGADPAPVVAAARAGARVVLSPGNQVYLDMQYHEGFPLGQHWAGYVDVRDSYDWDPAAHLDIPAESVYGVEAAVWTEWIVTDEDLFTMLLPRLVAVAEVGWSEQGQRDWDQFVARLRAQAPLWETHGLAYHRSEQVF